MKKLVARNYCYMQC